MVQRAVLALEDGNYFWGTAIGDITNTEVALGEVVFNTSMTGYQEILSDPSYKNQLITLTCPHVGNVGINDFDFESKKIHAKGLIIRELSRSESNWRSTHSLDAWLQHNGVLGIQQIDTRRLTQILQKKGALRGAIVLCADTSSKAIEEAVQQAKNQPSMQGLDLAQYVTTQKTYIWQGGGSWRTDVSLPARYQIIVYDFGIKESILRTLHDLSCEVTVVPAQTSAAEVLRLNPHGVILSNGPGDPQACTYAIEAVRELLKHQIPMFGICLGFQLLALALGAKTYKMKFGHHGGNHPVQDVKTNRVMITAQNHGFAVEEATLPKKITITHRSLFDQTIQGFEYEHFVLGFQGHPEAGPGPTDAVCLFTRFLNKLTPSVHKKHSVMES